MKRLANRPPIDRSAVAHPFSFQWPGLFLVISVGCYVVLGRIAWAALRPAVKEFSSPVWFALLGAAAFGFPDFMAAAGFRVSPDSVEYVLAGQRFFASGTYAIEIDGQLHPPRYSPWFSLLHLGPALAFAGHNGAGVLFIYLSSLIVLFVIAALAQRMAGQWGAVIAIAALALTPGFFGLGREIMTEMPVTAAIMLAAVVYVDNGQLPLRQRVWATAFLGGWAFAARPLGAALALPLIFELYRLRRWGHIATVLMPIVFLCALSAVYNTKVFSALTRTGYHYWLALPHDSLLLTFHPRYILQNLSEFAAQAAPILGGAVAFAALRFDFSAAFADRGRTLLRFAVISGLPIIAVHLLYYYEDRRLFFPALIPFVPLTAALIAKALEKFQSWSLPVSVVTMAALIMGRIIAPPSAERSELIQSLRQLCESGCIAVTGSNIAQLQKALGPSAKVYAASRSAEYASKFAAPRRIDVAPLSEYFLTARRHRFPEFAKLGGIEVAEYTADERFGSIAAAAQSGSRVLVDTRSAPDFAAALSKAGLRLESAAPGVALVLPGP